MLYVSTVLNIHIIQFVILSFLSNWYGIIIPHLWSCLLIILVNATKAETTKQVIPLIAMEAGNFIFFACFRTCQSTFHRGFSGRKPATWLNRRGEHRDRLTQNNSSAQEEKGNLYRHIKWCAITICITVYHFVKSKLYARA